MGAGGYAFGDFFISDAIGIKITGSGVDEARNDHTTEIEHETIGDTHDGHVGGVSTGGHEEADGFIGPSLTGEFEQVFEGGVDVVVVDGRSHHDSGGRTDEGGGFGHVGITVGRTSITKGQGKIPQIESLVFDPIGGERGAGGVGEQAAFTTGIKAGGNDKEAHGGSC